MKKLTLAIFCLLLTACGVFEVNVRMFPGETETARAAITASPEFALSPTAQTPTVIVVTATPSTSAQPEPTSSVMQPGSLITLATLQMTDSAHGWGVESSGRILKTADGASTWKDVTPFEGSFDAHSLFAFNNETAWAVPAQTSVSNVVWHTQDGGVTWGASQPIELGSGRYSPLGIQFPNPRDGWLLLLPRDSVQDTYVLLYKSGDGGETWEQVGSLLNSVSQSYLPDTHTTMTFFNGQTGWLGGWWGKDNPNQWTVLKTVDGGATWTTEALALPDNGSLTCNGRPVTGMEPGAMAVDISCTQASDPKFRYHHLYYLSAAGLPAWRSRKLSGEFKGIDFVDANDGWMLVAPGGPLSEIHSTIDGGKTWTNINIVGWKQARFDFVSGVEGWAIVGDGSVEAIVRTVNGGLIWEEIKPVVAKP